MNRWFLTLTVAVLAFPVHAREDEAENLFRQAEKKLLDAKTVRVEFDLKLGENEGGGGKGILVLGEGDKMRLDGAGGTDKFKFTRAPRIGDCTKIYTVLSREKPRIEDSPKGLGKALRGLLARPGIILDLDTITSKPALNKAFKLSNFKLGPKEKIGDIEARAIEYTVLVKGRLTEPPDALGPRISLWAGGPTHGFFVKHAEIPVKLWIDTSASIPVKLEIRWAPAVAEGNREFTESLRFTINGKVDDKLFEPPN